MVDVNNCPRKRKSETTEVNEDDASTSTLQQPSTDVESSEPAEKMVKCEEVMKDTEMLSENVITNDNEPVKIDNSDQEMLLCLQEENLQSHEQESTGDIHIELENSINNEVESINNKLDTINNDATVFTSESINNKLDTINNDPTVITSENINNEVESINNELESSNNKLDTISNDNTVTSENENEHIITISFHNELIAESYRNKFIHFLKNIKEFVHVSSDLEIKISKNGLDCKDGKVHSSDNSRKRKRKKSKTADLFVVDKTPGESAERLELKYTSKYSVQSEEKQSTPKANANVCFNCNKNHNLRDCPEPKDYSKITAARTKMKSQQVVKTRYHMDEDQKYAHFTPGKISEQLRDALGMHYDELPPYIYKMRVFGYPPGWLEEAKIVHSNISLFDSDGKEDYNGKHKIANNINVDKIVDYPGFNMPLEEGVIDDYRINDCPPFSSRCSKEAMINFIKESYEKEKDNTETCDMDLDQNTNDSTLPPGCDEVFSPSLTDLEKKKLELLAELDNGGSNSEPEEKKNGEKILDVSNAEFEKVECKEEIEKEDILNGISPASSPVKDNVKLSVLGTPIIQSTSPYCVLPHPDKFSKDISPVINFENLPNSTGKYEQMTVVLQKVRKTLKDINEKSKP